VAPFEMHLRAGATVVEYRPIETQNPRVFRGQPV